MKFVRMMSLRMTSFSLSRSMAWLAFLCLCILGKMNFVQPPYLAINLISLVRKCLIRVGWWISLRREILSWCSWLLIFFVCVLWRIRAKIRFSQGPPVSLRSMECSMDMTPKSGSWVWMWFRVRRFTLIYLWRRVKQTPIMQELRPMRSLSKHSRYRAILWWTILLWIWALSLLGWQNWLSVTILSIVRMK